MDDHGSSASTGRDDVPAEPFDEGVPPLAPILLIGNVFVFVAIVLVDVTAVRVLLALVATSMVVVGVAMLARHRARLQAHYERRDAWNEDTVDGGQ